MKTFVKKVTRDERGAGVLALVLILLVVGGLILTPLLGLMSTGLMAGQVYERKTDELYAADAGVEDAVWKIQHQDQVPQVKNLYCGGGNNSWSYNVTNVNGKGVSATITYVSNVTHTYRVESLAIADGSGTKINAYVTGKPISYSSITDYILCSQGEVEWGNKVTLNYTEPHGPEDFYADPWPTPEELAQFYWEDVKNQTPYANNTVDIAGVNMTRGPLYRNGTLEILNSSKTPATFTLNGTLYITGDTLIGQNGKDTLTLDLNGQTIFVESSSANAIIVGGKCTVKGPGAIIAVGDVYFAPKGDVGGNEEPVFILSVSGTTKLQPSGDFYGSVAGSIWVDVQPGYSPTITYPPDGFTDSDLNFPGFGEPKLLTYSIASWEVSGL